MKEFDLCLVAVSLDRDEEPRRPGSHLLISCFVPGDLDHARPLDADILGADENIERVTHWEDGRAVGFEVIESDWPIHFMRWITRVDPAVRHAPKALPHA